jgi:DNA-binding CsgD family transcriptional regulator
VAPIRLALVDDHKMLLGALTEWIRNAADDISMVAAVTTWPELLTHPEFPVVSAELDLALNAADVGGAPKLSAQERRVMALYGGGEPVKSVAYQLGISEETAKSYLKRIREKYRVAGIDVGTKVALRKRAIQDGILIQDVADSNNF